MSEADIPLFDACALPEILFEDIRDLSISNGIFRCTLYAFRKLPGCAEPVPVPVMNLALPVSSVAPCANKALAKVAEQSIKAAADFVRERFGLSLH